MHRGLRLWAAAVLALAATTQGAHAAPDHDPPPLGFAPDRGQRGQFVTAYGRRCHAEWAVLHLSADSGGHEQRVEFRTEADGSWFGRFVVEGEAVVGGYAAKLWCRTGDTISYADGADGPLWRGFRVVAGEVPRLSIVDTTVAPGAPVMATISGCRVYDQAWVTLRRDGTPMTWNGGEVEEGDGLSVEVPLPPGATEGQWFEAVGECRSPERELQSNLVPVVIAHASATPPSSPPTAAPEAEPPPTDPAPGAAPATETTTTTAADESRVQAATHRPQAKQEGGGSDRATPALALLFLLGAGAATWHRLRRRPS